MLRHEPPQMHGAIGNSFPARACRKLNVTLITGQTIAASKTGRTLWLHNQELEENIQIQLQEVMCLKSGVTSVDAAELQRSPQGQTRQFKDTKQQSSQTQGCSLKHSWAKTHPERSFDELSTAPASNCRHSTINVVSSSRFHTRCMIRRRLNL